jgi:proline iminopeptidase
MSRYPEVEPIERGMLDVGDGQQVYFEVCGGPNGKPAVVLHGGPGSGCTPGLRRYFDPAAYRIVLFDQRGAGRSVPHAGDPTVDLSINTTHHLIADIERLREHLGVERWLVFGGSWGATLALAYAERYPQRVTEIVLASVTMTRPADSLALPRSRSLLPRGVGPLSRRGADRETGDDLVAAYYHLLNQPDPAVWQKAAQAWCDWEDAVVSLESDYQPNPRYDDHQFRMAFARIVTHYFHHRAWLEDGILLREAHRLAGIPSVLVHGRLDLGSPAGTAWELAQARCVNERSPHDDSEGTSYLSTTAPWSGIKPG